LFAATYDLLLHPSPHPEWGHASKFGAFRRTFGADRWRIGAKFVIDNNKGKQLSASTSQPLHALRIANARNDGLGFVVLAAKS
jgi:hypothetical protein